jgi:hypothetical protein
MADESGRDMQMEKDLKNLKETKGCVERLQAMKLARTPHCLKFNTCNNNTQQKVPSTLGVSISVS